jgi:mono/diheme cytochrome c family protein
MPFVTRHSLITLAVASVAAGAVLGIFVWSGLYNIGADDTHTKPVYALLQAMREQSINRHASSIKVPDLTDAALIRQGAGNYDSMCTGCHLAPGMESTELSKGLYPAPPAFASAEVGDPAHHFWVIKHGIKASGMPAWGKSMDDPYIWGMVAFIQQLPHLDASQYHALVASSGGHSHGGGESPAHGHRDEAPDHHHDEAAEPAADAAAPKTMTHRHADGTVESHPIVAEHAHEETAEHHHDH